MDATQQFKDAMAAAGLTPPDEIIPTRRYRFPGAGKSHGNTSGWCMLFDDCRGGVYGDWSTGLSGSWHVQRRANGAMSPVEYEAFKRRVAESQAQAEAERKSKQLEAASKAGAVWKAGTPVSADNPYLTRKLASPVATLREIDAAAAAAILGYAPKSGDDELAGRLLVVPVKVGDGLSTLEFIDEAGRKSAVYGGAKAGGYWAAQPLPEGNGDGLTLLIGEGVATVLSSFEASSHPSIAALSSGNLLAVAKAMRERYPAAVLVVLADLLKATGEPDPHAIEAALAVGGVLAVPDFGDNRPDGATDFNDMCQLRGLEAVRAAVASATPPAPGAESEGNELPDDAAIIEAAIAKLADDVGAVFEPDVLAALKKIRSNKPADWQRYRTRIKKAGGIVGELDRLTGASSDGAEDTRAKGHKVTLYEPEPWLESVDGAVVLDAAFDAIKRHMFIVEEYAITATLWVAHSHVFDVFSHTPRLGVSAPREDCGKTLLLFHLVGSLTTKPQTGDLMRAAPFFRMTEEHKPTWLIDEIDVFIKDDCELLAALNNGWEPHGGVPRCVGEDFEVRIFRTHAPVAFGGVKIEKVLPATTLSRTLVIPLQRATRGEITEDYDARKHRAGLLEIGRKLARWCSDNQSKLRDCEPALPGDPHNRRADKWMPLFAIAQVAGGDWPARAKRAFLTDEQSSDAKLGAEMQLLLDIREVLIAGEEKIHTEELINRLCRIEESHWTGYNFKERDPQDRKIQPKQLSSLLAGYNIRSANREIEGIQKKGYLRKEFDMVLFRYLPPKKSVHPSTSNGGAGFHDFHPSTNSTQVDDKPPSKPNAGAGVDGWTAKKGRCTEKIEVSADAADGTQGGAPDDGDWGDI